MKVVNRIFICCLVLSVIFIVGCMNKVDGESVLISEEGVKVESFFPSDVWVVFKLGSNDRNQIQNMNKLAEKFPINPLEFINQSIADGFNEDLEKYQLSYENDLLPALGDNWQVMFAMAGDIENDSEPQMLFAIVPKDAQKIEELFEKLVKEGGEVVEYKQNSIYRNPAESAFFARYEDVWLMGNSMEIIKESLDNVGNSTRLLADRNYQSGVGKMQDQYGFFFINSGPFFSQIQKNQKASEELEGVQKMLDIVSTVRGEFFGLTMEEEGMRIKGFIATDMGKWKELGLPVLDDLMMRPYLYKQLPGDNVAMYTESMNMKLSIEMMMDVYLEMREMADVISTVKGFLMMNGLDLEDDLLVFMDKGYAFELQTGEGLLPYLGFYVDASSSPKSAKKVMAKIFDGIGEVIDEKLLDVVKNEQVECGGECYMFTFDFNELPDKAKEDVVPELMREPVKFSYGLNGDNLAYLTLYPDFAAVGYETLEQNSDFQGAMKYIEGYDSQGFYVDIEEFLEYADRWVQFGVNLEKNGKDMSQYDMVMEYLKPFKFMVMGVKEISNEELEMEGFIKIVN